MYFAGFCLLVTFMGPDDGVPQGDGVAVPVRELHVVELQVHAVGVRHQRLTLEGHRIQVAGLDLDGLAEIAVAFLLKASDQLDFRGGGGVHEIPASEFLLPSVKGSAEGVVLDESGRRGAGKQGDGVEGSDSVRLPFVVVE